MIGFFLGSSVLFFQCEAIVVSKNILLLICPSTVEVQNQSLFTCFHSLSLFVLLVVSRWHSLCHILSLLTCCHLLSFVVILCHSLSLVVPLVVSCCQLLYHSLPFICFHFYHLLSLFLARCTTCLCFYKRSLKKDYLSWLNWFTSILNVKLFKTKKQIKTVTDYNIWPVKLSGPLNFWRASCQFFLLNRNKSHLNVTL